VQVNDVIGMAARGDHAVPVFDMRDPMGLSTCVTCGECAGLPDRRFMRNR
jgi:formate dehydrogenase major subunit